MAARITLFGTSSAGAAVEAVTLRAGELTARLLTYGATLQDLRLAGTPWPLCLGSDSLAAYEGPLIWCGAVVGPVANRVGGAAAVVGGRLWQMAANDGPNVLHSGPESSARRVWQIAEAEEAEVSFELPLAHGACGLPGNRLLRARYRLLPPATLEITLSAHSDAETLMNLAAHPYWNLDGTVTTEGHLLSVAASSVLPTDARNLPQPPQPVLGTGYDLRRPRPLAGLPPIDHNFCLDGTGLRAAARLAGARGVVLTLETDAPGLQVYDGRALNTAPFLGLSGAPYTPHAGVALEPQMWPDAPAHADFPSITLAPRVEWTQRTRLHFQRLAQDKADRA